MANLRFVVCGFCFWFASLCVCGCFWCCICCWYLFDWLVLVLVYLFSVILIIVFNECVLDLRLFWFCLSLFCGFVFVCCLGFVDLLDLH